MTQWLLAFAAEVRTGLVLHEMSPEERVEETNSLRTSGAIYREKINSFRWSRPANEKSKKYHMITCVILLFIFLLVSDAST